MDDLQPAVPAEEAAARRGRPRGTSRRTLELIALRLFAEQGFDETTIEQIAAEAGVSRRTFFRYFDSKASVLWGEFDSEISVIRDALARVPDSVPMMEAIRQAVIEFNRLPPDQVHQHRRRMSLILGVPTLLANSTLRFAQWREVLATFAAGRLGLRPDDLLPNVVGYSALGATLAGYDEWLRDEASDLVELLDAALGELAVGFHHHDRSD